LIWPLTSGDSPVSVLAIDPQEPQVLYAGTSHSVFRTVNGGATWTVINLVGPHPVRVLDVKVDPVNRATVYVATEERGILKSRDYGQNSNRLLNSPPTVHALAIDGTNPATVYAGTPSGVFKSVDGGMTWSASSSGLPAGDVLSLAIDPETPTTLYATLNSPGHVFKSLDGGASWTALGASGIAGSKMTAVAIDPLEPSTVYAGTSGFGVRKTTDGGATWITRNTSMDDAHVEVVAFDPLVAATIYAGLAGGGIAKTTDDGITWAPINAGLGNPFIRALAVDPFVPDTLYAGTAGGVFRSTDGGASWSARNAGLRSPRNTWVTVLDVRSLVIDPETETLYAGTWGRDLHAFKSLDDGASWMACGLLLDGTYVSVRKLIIDPADGGALYAGTSSGVFKSRDSCATWTSVGNDSVAAHDLAVDPADGTLYKVTAEYERSQDGSLLKLASDGSWHSVDLPGSPTGGKARAIAFDGADPSTLYVGTVRRDPWFVNDGVGVFQSTDGGASWTVRGQPLEAIVTTLAISPLRPAKIYAGTATGVFESQPFPTFTIGPARWGAAGWTVTVSVTNSFRHPRDRMALYRFNGSVEELTDWKYLNGSKTEPAQGLTTATVTFRLPPAAGHFQVRVFSESYGGIWASGWFTAGFTPVPGATVK
jgi:photosystem II stability/assembly factor-like uncharacterized protein